MQRRCNSHGDDNNIRVSHFDINYDSWTCDILGYYHHITRQSIDSAIDAFVSQKISVEMTCKQKTKLIVKAQAKNCIFRNNSSNSNMHR